MHMSIFPLTKMHMLVTWIHVLVTLLKLNYSYTAATTTHVLLPFFPKNLLWCWLAIWCLYDASILLLLPFYLLLYHWILGTTLNWILPHAVGALLSTLFYLLWLLLAAVVHLSLTVHFYSSVGLCSFWTRCHSLYGFVVLYYILSSLFYGSYFSISLDMCLLPTAPIHYSSLLLALY